MHKYINMCANVCLCVSDSYTDFTANYGYLWEREVYLQFFEILHWEHSISNKKKQIVMWWHITNNYFGRLNICFFSFS